MKNEIIFYQPKCANVSPYTGCTNNLEARLERHAKGYVFSTKDKLPIELEMYVAFNDKYKALFNRNKIRTNKMNQSDLERTSHSV